MDSLITSGIFLQDPTLPVGDPLALRSDRMNASNSNDLTLLVPGEDTPRILRGPWPATIGRDGSCTVVLSHRRVSSQHARIVAEGDRFLLEDLGSVHGTRVNGARVERAVLGAGDRVEIGGEVLQVVDAGAGEASPSGVIDPSAALLRALEELTHGDDTPAEERLGRALERLRATFEADRALVFAPVEGGLEVMAGDDGPEPVSRTLLRRVAEEGRSVLTTNHETDELREVHASIALDVRSIVAAPLGLESGRGVLYLESRAERRRFREADQQAIHEFARAAARLLEGLVEQRRHRDRAARLAEVQRRALAADELVGASPRVESLRAELARAAPTPVNVLLTGETGTGKELAARALHGASERAGQTFVAVNCAAIPSELLESELFGHVKGAFSGANDARPGRFELADGGTLFLDEIGELPLPAQAKLLRVLQERKVTRVGGSREIPVDFRLVAATNVDLEAAVREGTFREDLFFRVAVFRIALPPLRERGDDVLLLAERFLADAARDFRRDLSGISGEARRILREHSWPGNVRELKNVVEQAVIREPGAELGADAVQQGLGRPSLAAAPALPENAVDLAAMPETLSEARRELERQYLVHRILAHQVNMTATARSLGIARKNLYARCKELGIDPSGLR